jgi:hypothetical protein
MLATWLRRWRRWILLSGCAVALYAVLGFFVVPWIARHQIVAQARSALEREAVVGPVRFNPFTFRAVVERLQLKDRDGAALFDLDRLVVDLQLSGIFRRAWRFREISVEGPALHLRILPDGRPSIADLMEPAPAPERQEAAVPRLIVDLLRLQRGRASFVDTSRSPRFVQEISPLELEVHDLITIPRESGDHTLALGLGKDASLRWRGRQTLDPLHLDGRLELRGIPLARIWEYVAAGQPLVVRSGRGEVLLSYDIQQAADGSVALAVKDASVLASDFRLGPKDVEENWLEVSSLEATGIEGAWPKCLVTVPSVRLRSPKILVRVDASGALNWAALAPSASSAPAETAATTPWTAALGVVDVADGEVVLDDGTVAPPVKTTLSALGLRLKNVSTDLAAPVGAEMTALVNGSGKATLGGTILPDTLSADLQVAISDLDVTPFQSYAVRLPGAELRRLKGGLDGRLRVSDGTPWIQFEGSGSFAGLDIAGAGQEHLLGCERARLSGLRVTLQPNRLRVGEVLLDGASFKIHIDPQGNINLAQLGVPTEEPAAASAPAPSPEKAMVVDVAKIVFANAGGEFTDESLILPFGTRIHSMNGDLRDFSTRNTAPARLDLEGRVLEEGYFKSLGTLRVADPLAASDVNVIFRDVQLPSLSPYSAQFAGYSMQQGMLDLDVRYRFDDRRMVGDHRVIAKDLVLGPKVEGAEGPGLPVRLAVALLKDKDGRIDLEVPVEGTVDAPEFNYRAVFWQAVKKILAHAAAAPFRAIGRAFGADDEELELVGFAAGGAGLPAPEDEKLRKIAAELVGRDGIALEIEGRFDPVTDASALRRARLEAKIDARRTPEATLDQILEALYAETFTPEKLEAERLQFGLTEAPSPALFYEGLQRELMEAERVEPADLSALAAARAQAIAAALTAPGGLDPGRVAVVDSAPVKRKKQGSDLVASEMTMTAED